MSLGMRSPRRDLAAPSAAFIIYRYAVANNAEIGNIMSNCNNSEGLLQVCYSWGQTVDLNFLVW